MNLTDEILDDILELYLNGGSDVEVKALIWDIRGSFSNDLWDRWLLEDERFSETIKAGKMLSNAWWLKQGRTNLQTKEFSYTGWYMNMKNRFGWKDKQEIDHSGDVLKGISVKIVGTTDNSK